MYTCVSRFEQIVYFSAAQRGGSEKEIRPARQMCWRIDQSMST